MTKQWIEYISCPLCHKKQQALVWFDEQNALYDEPIRVHDCDCGYQIKGIEWELTSIKEG